MKDVTYGLYHNWSTTETNNDFDRTGPDLNTKKRLRRGDYKALNVYVVKEFNVDEGTWILGV
jgi:hypothetical protein